MAGVLDWSQAEVFEAWVKPELFGGNLLFDRDLPEGTYGTVFRNLGLTTVRYPGGSITEWFFDIENPDATQIVDPERGTRDLLPLSSFLAWAGAEDYGVDLVIPTASLMTGPDGDQVPEATAYAQVRGYVLDVLSGRYGTARIESIELGNEYWLGGEMNVTEYARIADVMARAAQEAIDTYRAQEALPPGWVEPMISVQVGQYGEHSQARGWEQNEYLMAALSDEAAAAIDAVVMHYYARGAFADLPEHDYIFDRFDTWAAEARFEDVAYHVTEWSTENWDTEERGLRQASSMIWIMSDMVARGVDRAHVWPVQQQTENDLSGDEGQEALTLAGEGVRLMAESLPGLTLERRLNFAGGYGYLYQGSEETVVFLTSRRGEAQEVRLDLASLGLSGLAHWTTHLDSEAPSDPDGLPEMVLAGDLGLSAGTMEVALGAFGIARLVFSDRAPGVLMGSAGPDEIRAGTTPVELLGRLGDDRLLGGAAADTLRGGGGADWIKAGAGEDLITAGAGNDTVLGSGNDLSDLGAGDDTYEALVGTFGADKVFGGTGDDLIRGRAGDDGISGDAGADTLFGGEGRDTVFGRAGDDLLYGGRGADEVSGGSGADVLYGGSGSDTLDGGSDADALYGEIGADRLLGGPGADALSGGEGDDLLSGGSGEDLLFGGSGADTLSGGDGADTLEGGPGADRFVFDRDDGVDLILGFQEQDRIDLRGQGLAFEELLLLQSGADAIVRFAGTEIILEDLGRTLTPGDFDFF